MLVLLSLSLLGEVGEEHVGILMHALDLIAHSVDPCIRAGGGEGRKKRRMSGLGARRMQHDGRTVG